MFDIVHASPGRRFQERYERRLQSERGRVARCGVICAGVVLTIVGLFFLAAPGPTAPELRIRRWLRR